MNAERIAEALASSAAFRGKVDIGRIAARVPVAPRAVAAWSEREERILLGDDTAAIPDRDGFLLLAAEGMLPDFLERDPYFAGWSSVMVNVSDVASMGGYPLAVVDVYFHTADDLADRVLAGMRDAALAYGVPVVGGHTSRTTAGPHALAVAILGRAERLMTSFDARPDDVVLYAVDLRGAYHGDFPFWNATTGRSHEDLRADLALLGRLAHSGAVHACKDVSNAGVAGTLLMMLEASRLGGVLDLDRVPVPHGVDLGRWLSTFPSFGFLLAVAADDVPRVRAELLTRGLACEPIAKTNTSSQLHLASEGSAALLWDLEARPFTGFAKPIED